MRDTLASIKTICDTTKNPTDIAAYNSYKTIYKQSITLTKSNAYHNFIQNSTNKIKSSWRIVNFERNSPNLSNSCHTDTNPNIFNEYFCTVADNLIKSLSKSNTDPAEYLNHVPAVTCSFFLEPVTHFDVIDAVNALKNTNSFDIHDINTRIIKETIDYFLHPLTNLINACFSEGVFPDVFKTSKVIPVYKKGDVDDPGNYRPISLISTFAKIIEIILKNRLSKYFEKYGLLHKYQFGFRSKCSTIEAVCQIVSEIVEGLESGKHIGLTLCDLTKAFDCVDHKLLLSKLEFYGIRGVPLALFESYLSNRQQCVFLNNNLSNRKGVQHGVPQGSVLGPLFFIIYINDLFFYLFPYSIIMFADDATLVNSSKNISELNYICNKTEKLAEIWYNDNKLNFNKSKTQNLIVSTKINDNPYQTVKLLGIHIDNKLSWSVHIEHLCSKLSSYVYLLRQLKKVLQIDTLLTVYYSLIHSHLSYGVTIWEPSREAIRVFRLQKQAIRILANAKYREHCQPLFKRYGIMPLPCLYIYYSLLHIHKHKDKYITFAEYHTHSTRTSNHIRPPFLRLTKSKKNSPNVNLYNKLPIAWKMFREIKFKATIRKHLLKHCFYTVEEFMATPAI